MQKGPGVGVEPVCLLPPVSLHHLRYQVLGGFHQSRRPYTLATIGYLDPLSMQYSFLCLTC